ncbi:MAG: Trm112 family protein [Cystobacter sp.]
MTLSEEQWALLACPGCKGVLSLEPSREGARDSGRLCCSECGLAYPLRDGVPELLVEEARPLRTSGG